MKFIAAVVMMGFAVVQASQNHWDSGNSGVTQYSAGAPSASGSLIYTKQGPLIEYSTGSGVSAYSAQPSYDGGAASSSSGLIYTKQGPLNSYSTGSGVSAYSAQSSSGPSGQVGVYANHLSNGAQSYSAPAPQTYSAPAPQPKSFYYSGTGSVAGHGAVSYKSAPAPVVAKSAAPVVAKYTAVNQGALHEAALPGYSVDQTAVNLESAPAQPESQGWAPAQNAW